MTWGGYLFEQIAATGLASVPDGSIALTGRVLIRAIDLDLAFPASDAQLECRIAAPEQLPPYLRFMIEAAKQLGVSGSERLPKQHIISWLENNWPRGLGAPSNSKLEFMATFLRHPDDEKGGHFRPARQR